MNVQYGLIVCAHAQEVIKLTSGSYQIDLLLCVAVVCCHCSEQYVAEKCKAMPLNLQLLPLLPADALPLEPDTDRPYKVTVISTTPGVKALTVG